LKPVYKPGYLLFFLLLVNTTSFSQGTWERLSIPTDKFLRSVCFTDSLYGWVAGDSGTIIHTTDGGKTWNFQDSKTKNEIADIFFLDRNRGWASSFNYSVSPFGTVILKTTNGGADWTSVAYPAENIFMNCILFLDSLNGWMGGMPHALVKTTNGGIDWTEAEVDSSVFSQFPVLNIKFYDRQYGYACGGMHDIAGVIWRTSDGGDKWYAIDPAEAPADEVFQLYLFDSLNVMGAGGDPDFGYGVGMIRTSDGGLTWNYHELGIIGNAFDLAFRTDKEAWAPLGPSLKLIYSKDAGSTWTDVSTPDSTSIYNLIFTDSLHGFATGRNGAVLKYKPPLVGGIDQNTLSDPQKFILYQNYPNPFNDETKIKFSIPASFGNAPVSVQIKVYNLIGRELKTPVNKDVVPGTYEVKFDAEDIPAGVYYYQMRVLSKGMGTFSSVPRKMIILK
jgi:photosystem II stability/assembly factor-like uncharacterized protein